MKHIKQVFVFLSFLLASATISLSDSLILVVFPRERRRTAGPFSSRSIILGQKKKKIRAPKPNEWEIEIQGTGDGQGRAT
jgi:hypothetical protein